MSEREEDVPKRQRSFLRKSFKWLRNTLIADTDPPEAGSSKLSSRRHTYRGRSLKTRPTLTNMMEEFLRSGNNVDFSTLTDDVKERLIESREDLDDPRPSRSLPKRHRSYREAVQRVCARPEPKPQQNQEATEETGSNDSGLSVGDTGFISISRLRDHSVEPLTRNGKMTENFVQHRRQSSLPDLLDFTRAASSFDVDSSDSDEMSIRKRLSAKLRFGKRRSKNLGSSGSQAELDSLDLAAGNPTNQDLGKVKYAASIASSSPSSTLNRKARSGMAKDSVRKKRKEKQSSAREREYQKRYSTLQHIEQERMDLQKKLDTVRRDLLEPHGKSELERTQRNMVEILARMGQLHHMAAQERTGLSHYTLYMQYEQDVKQVLDSISEGESMLTVDLICPTSLHEVSILRKDFDRFQQYIKMVHSNAQKIIQDADRLISAVHPDMDNVRLGAQRVMDKWRKLYNQAEERQKLVRASNHWLNTLQQVRMLLHRLEIEYVTHDHQSVSDDTEEIPTTESGIQTLLCKHVSQKNNFLKTCTQARHDAQTFLRYIDRNAHLLGLPLSRTQSSHEHVEGVLRRIHKDEILILQHWIRKHESLSLQLTELCSPAPLDGDAQVNGKRKLDYIMEELLQTERVYVKDLYDCLAAYMMPLAGREAAAEFHEASQGATHEAIFGNIEDIYNFHKDIFLPELERFETLPEDCGHAFVTWADKFNIYVNYCQNKGESSSLLLESCIDIFKRLQLASRLPMSLESYLIKPVQRITKYQLLLKDLLANCDSGDTEIREALDVMLGVPKQANDSMHLKLLEYTKEDVPFLGDVILQDKLVVSDPKTIVKKSRDRQVFLFENCILMSKEISDAGATRYIYKYRIMINELESVDEDDDVKFMLFTNIDGEAKLVLKAPSVKSKQRWTTRLRGLLRHQLLDELTDDRSKPLQLAPLQSTDSRLSGEYEQSSRHSLDSEGSRALDDFIPTLEDLIENRLAGGQTSEGHYRSTGGHHRVGKKKSNSLPASITNSTQLL